jgi:VanZ family protein
MRLIIYIRDNWVAITLFILTGITVVSLWPLEKLPPVPGTDKIHHLIAYAILMFPSALRKPNKWILLCLLFIAYSVIIELLQPYVNRHFEWLDLAANAIGVVCGLISAELINYLFPTIGTRSQ